MALTGLVLPLEIRSVTGGAFIANSFDYQAINRLAASGVAQHVARQFFPDPEVANECSGPVSQMYRLPGSASGTFFASPSAIMWSGVNSTEPCLAAGSDGVPGSGSPSLLLTFDVTAASGEFEIDTCCVRPANHLAYGICGTYDCLLPAFTKGVITIACHCPCWADPHCDSIPNVQDVVATVDVAFRGGTPTFDLSCWKGNPAERTDLSCDGVSTVIDVVRMVDVAFRGYDPATRICDPCLCDPYPTSCPPLP
ncbi:MAG: hypothetical protein AB1792_07725 [Candidatus Zixiibacteriota bacterium]